MLDLNSLPLPALYTELFRSGLVRRLLELARDEDLGDASSPTRGDITSELCIPGGAAAIATARIACRAPGVLAGLAALPDSLSLFAPRCALQLHAADGDSAAAGDTLATISGPLREILAAERTLLNLLSRLSGIATLTREFVRAIERAAPSGRAPRAQLFDTRKTTPGLRVLEKYAVRCGGGFCHRLGLHDAILIKDNHLAGVPPGATASAVGRALRAVTSDSHRALRFTEVEVDTLDQLRELLSLEHGLIDIILLDNMPPATLREAVALRDKSSPRVLLEASGGISLDTIGAIAQTGVDRISAGALTHSAPALDIALDIDHRAS